MTNSLFLMQKNIQVLRSWIIADHTCESAGDERSNLRNNKYA